MECLSSSSIVVSTTPCRGVDPGSIPGTGVLKNFDILNLELGAHEIQTYLKCGHLYILCMLRKEKKERA